jgi:hypothetical protein
LHDESVLLVLKFSSISINLLYYCFIKLDFGETSEILDGNISPLVDKILRFHKTKAFREFREYNELTFQTVLQLLIPSKVWLSEMRLITNPLQTKGNNRFGFVDLFVCCLHGYRCIVLELKCIPLLGLFNGNMKKWNDNTNYKDLVQFDTLLSSEPEDDLINRRYFYWSRDEKKYIKTSVIETINSGISQIQIYLDTIKNGRARKNKSGICDVKIEVEDGYSYIGVCLIFSMGSQRIITRDIGFCKMDYRIFISK